MKGSATLKLYQFPSSPNCMKVRAVAYEVDVELDLVTVNIFKGEARSPQFDALNPNRLVPVLVDGDFVLWESNAILTYLADVRTTLSPRSPRQRADVDRWLHWQSAHLGPAVSKVAFERFVKPMTRRRPIDHAAARAAATEFFACCRVVELSLGNAAYLAQELSVADFAVACILNGARTVGLGLDGFPRIKNWLARMWARDSVRRALADGQVATIAACDGDGSDPTRN